MNHKRGPYRQCIGCRRVFPKGELLRFVRGDSGDMLLDVRQTAHGRGLYLCPERDCFTCAGKKRKAGIRIEGASGGERLFASAYDGILHALEALLAVGNGRFRDAFAGDIEAGDILLASEDQEDRRLEVLIDAAHEKGAYVFVVPRAVLGCEEPRVITKRSSKISPLLRNLRFYERLSSKGRAL